MSVTEALEREVTDSDGEAESPGDLLAEVERRRYGDYIAGDVDEVRLNPNDGEIEFVVDIPGADGTKTWGWPPVSGGGETNLHRILRDHGLSPAEVEQMEGRRVLVRPHPRKRGTWKMYDPESSDKTVPQEWYDERPFTPYSAGRIDDGNQILFPVIGFVSVYAAAVASGMPILPATVAAGVVGAAVAVLVKAAGRER